MEKNSATFGKVVEFKKESCRFPEKQRSLLHYRIYVNTCVMYLVSSI